MIGGHAAIYHGVRRTTSDLDILVRPTEENGERIMRALKSLGLDITDIKSSDFVQQQVFSFGLEPDRVDILNFSKGILIDDIFNHAKPIKIDNLIMKIIDIRDLLKNKENLQREGVKNLVDQQDILVLRDILKSRGSDD
ncbi:MAG TPA: hypothetical protein VGD65_09755 [Chryseosolibacter sp.]